MSSSNRLVVGALMLTLVAAAAGGWIGVRYGVREARPAPGLNEFLHHKLNLTDAQEQQIASLESEFAERRKALDQEIRGANRELAAAILSEHAYGPAAKGAVGRFHAAAETLLEQTIIHVLAMRAVLTTEQAQKFDATVSEALTSARP